MKTDQLFQHYLKEAETDFSGWDFSHITETGRLATGMLSWSYGSMAKTLMAKATSMLDMGTGGGELLSKLQPFPQTVCATEGYQPNFPLAKERLEPLGVRVVKVEPDNQLFFPDKYFDLIINKHEEYDSSEVRRVLQEGGTFLTQQVGWSDCQDINRLLGAPINEEYAHWDLEFAHKQLEDYGFQVLISKKEYPIQRFYDIGALIYYLKAIPWQVVDFRVEDYLDPLYDLHLKINREGYLDIRQDRFILKATGK
ncbi:class I SAM-dependent methyltransferase [Sutcliffiella horikoshii]|uniref:class I SAM-dependent methyltransferase n=1 Tax=Sutcliffiella horikoshii TaxID=79883 RepID=UPI001F46FEAA|nr:methyltransferase domain-containing protein [Sutcliffiella horikoshii]MCG1023629.1 methyltransferase domain-containing protein [Sutcliffiella horikoshii]